MEWIQKYRKASGQTKFLIWTSIIYVFALIASTIYCFGRLDFVRSYKTPTPPITKMEANL